jgi:membrane fusion protein (multidrug efflux system)
VQAAEWVGPDWVITEGLAAGDKVIVDNLIKLRPGMPVVEKTAENPAAPDAPQAEKPKA